MERKSDRVRRLVAAGDFKSALRIAKDFKLGISEDDRADMCRGYECLTNPRLYKSIGLDTAQIALKGVETVKRLYGV